MAGTNFQIKGENGMEEINSWQWKNRKKKIKISWKHVIQ